MKNLADTLAAKTAQLNQLQKEVDALRTAARILADDESETSKPKRGSRKSAQANLPTGTVITQPLMVRSVLLDSGAPLHAEKIADAIRKKFGVKLKPAYLVAVIYRALKKGKLFRKEGPNTFGLLEWPSGQLKLEVSDSMRAVQ